MTVTVIVTIDDSFVIINRPRSIFRYFNDNRISRKQGRRYGVEDVVEGVVPGDDGTNHTQRDKFHVNLAKYSSSDGYMDSVMDR